MARESDEGDINEENDIQNQSDALEGDAEEEGHSAVAGSSAAQHRVEENHIENQSGGENQLGVVSLESFIDALEGDAEEEGHSAAAGSAAQHRVEENDIEIQSEEEGHSTVAGSSAAQHRVSASHQKQQKSLVVAVEGTAALGPSWALLKSEYVEEIVRAFCVADPTGQTPVATREMSLVVFYSHGHSDCLLQRSGWTSNLDTFLQWLSAIEFVGGDFGEVAIAEGLTQVLMMCGPSLSMPSSVQGMECNRHCLLIAASDPHKLPTPVPNLLEGSTQQIGMTSRWRLADAEAVASSFSQNCVSLSVLSPKERPSLKALYNGAKRSGGAIETEADVPQHLILLSELFPEAKAILARNTVQSGAAPLHMPSAVTPPQQPVGQTFRRRYTKRWEGVLAEQRQGKPKSEIEEMRKNEGKPLDEQEARKCIIFLDTFLVLRRKLRSWWHPLLDDHQFRWRSCRLAPQTVIEQMARRKGELLSARHALQGSFHTSIMFSLALSATFLGMVCLVRDAESHIYNRVVFSWWYICSSIYIVDIVVNTRMYCLTNMEMRLIDLELRDHLEGDWRSFLQPALEEIVLGGLLVAMIGLLLLAPIVLTFVLKKHHMW